MRMLVLCAALLVAWAAPISASTVALWIFTGADPIPVNSTATGITASNLTRNGITDTPATTLFFGGSDWPVGGFSATSYFEMTLSPNPGFSVDYTSINLDYVVGSNPTFTTDLRSSLDGFTSSLATHVDSPGASTYDDSLAALGIQSGPVTFRIYGQVDVNTGTSSLYAGSVLFDGASEAVFSPEPSSMCLMAAGVLTLLTRLRNKTP